MPKRNSMTRMHFNAMAAVVCEKLTSAKREWDGDARGLQRERNKAYAMRDGFIEVARQFNDQFDSERFRTACEPKDK